MNHIIPEKLGYDGSGVGGAANNFIPQRKPLLVINVKACPITLLLGLVRDDDERIFCSYVSFFLPVVLHLRNFAKWLLSEKRGQN